MTDLIERLGDPFNSCSCRADCLAEIERLRVLLKRWQDGQDFHMKRAERAEAQLATAVYERDDYRNALHEVQAALATAWRELG